MYFLRRSKSIFPYLPKAIACDKTRTRYLGISGGVWTLPHRKVAARPFRVGPYSVCRVPALNANENSIGKRLSYGAAHEASQAEEREEGDDGEESERDRR